MEREVKATRYLREAIREYWGDNQEVERKLVAIGIRSSDDLVYADIDEISKRTGIRAEELAEFRARYTPAFLSEARVELGRVRRMYEEQIKWLKRRIGAIEERKLPLPVQKRLRAARDATKELLAAASRISPLTFSERQNRGEKGIIEELGGVCDLIMTLVSRLGDLSLSLRKLKFCEKEASALGSEADRLSELERSLEEELKRSIDLSSIRAIVSALSSITQTVLSIIETIEEKSRKVMAGRLDETKKLKERLEKALEEKNKIRLELDKRNIEILRLRKLIEMLKEDIKHVKAENMKLKKIVRDVLGDVLD